MYCQYYQRYCKLVLSNVLSVLSDVLSVRTITCTVSTMTCTVSTITCNYFKLLLSYVLSVGRLVLSSFHTECRCGRSLDSNPVWQLSSLNACQVTAAVAKGQGTPNAVHRRCDFACCAFSRCCLMARLSVL